MEKQLSRLAHNQQIAGANPASAILIHMDGIESEYLTFIEDDHYEGKTQRIVILSKRHCSVLGEIRWYGAWRQYAFYPEPETIWNPQCLDDVKACIKILADERKTLRDRTNGK